MSSSPAPQSTDVHAKALAINLEASIYGTFAEIGAGQEVARWFLSVGAASGTVAQAVSAYDKTFSDETYGRGTRYVSRERLLAMLDHEYQLLLDRLGQERGSTTRFFVFADTVATRNYQGTNEQHGWMGLRFQHQPGAQPSQILLHINLGDPTALLQQQAIGTLGVNLVYAAHQQLASAEAFRGGLFDDLSLERIAIDVFELSGPVFAGVDSRLWALDLLRRGMSEALVFDGHAQLVEPASALRKRPLIGQTAALDKPGWFGADSFQAALRQFAAERKMSEHPPAVALEISLRHLGNSAASGNPDILALVEKLAPLGAVVVTDYFEGYRFVEYLRRHTSEPIRMLIGIAALFKLWDKGILQASPGALLETLGRLFVTDVAVYVAPMAMEPFVAALGGLPAGFVQESAASGPMTLDDFAPPPPLDHLIQYLRGAGRFVPLAFPAQS